MVPAEYGCLLVSPQPWRKYIIPDDFLWSPRISILVEAHPEREFFFRIHVTGRGLLDPNRNDSNDYDGSECLHRLGRNAKEHSGPL